MTRTIEREHLLGKQTPGFAILALSIQKVADIFGFRRGVLRAPRVTLELATPVHLADLTDRLARLNFGEYPGYLLLAVLTALQA